MMSKSATDRRYLRSEAALQAALLHLVRTQPYPTVTVEGVVRTANVARKTFYAHHASLDELLWVSLRQVFDGIVAGMAELDPDTWLLNGKPLSYPLFAHVREYAQFYRWLLLDCERTRTLLQVWEYVAEVSYAKHGPLRQLAARITVPPPLLAQMLAGALLGAARWWLRENLSPAPESMAYTYSLVMAPGVMAALGVADP